MTTVDIISYEFFEDVGDGGVIDDLVDECDDIDGVESLCEFYCYERCAMKWSFFIEVVVECLVLKLCW